jgi:preprotein translocase SecE subunit
MAYKQDQGRMARMAAFWTLALLLTYGCVRLHAQLTSYFEVLAQPMGGVRIPVLGLDLSPALLIATVLAAGALLLLYRVLEKPKHADLLIQTESEMRKVTWPSLQDAINSSFVVLVTVLVLMAYLAGSDFVLGKWANLVLLGPGGGS